MVTLTEPAVETAICCPRCEPVQRVHRFGKHKGGNPRYRCGACALTFCRNPGTTAHPPEFRAMVLRAYQERASMRGICRTFGIGRMTLYASLGEKKAAEQPLTDTILPAQKGDIIECDELWSLGILRSKNLSSHESK